MPRAPRFRLVAGAAVLAVARLAHAQDESAFLDTRTLATSAPGSIRAALGASYLSGWSQPANFVEGDLWRLGVVRLSAGLAPGVSLELRGVARERLEIDAGSSSAEAVERWGRSTSDKGDTEATVLVRFLDSKGPWPAVGFSLGAKIGTSDDEKGISTNTLDVLARVHAEKALGRVTLSAELGIAFLTDTRVASDQNDRFLFGLAARYPVSPKLTLLGEFGGRSGETHNGKGAEDRIVLRAGAAYRVGRATLSVLGGPGLVPTSESWSVTAGISTSLFGR